MPDGAALLVCAKASLAGLGHTARNGKKETLDVKRKLQKHLQAGWT